MSESLYSENAEVFRQSLEGSPERAYKVYGLSLLYSLSPMELTRERYRLGLRPKSAHDYYNLGVLASQDGRHEDALSLYKKAEEIGGDFPALFYNLGLTYEHLNQKAKAVTAYTNFTELAKKADTEEIKSEIRSIKAHVRQLKG